MTLYIKDSYYSWIYKSFSVRKIEYYKLASSGLLSSKLIKTTLEYKSSYDAFLNFKQYYLPFYKKSVVFSEIL